MRLGTEGARQQKLELIGFSRTTDVVMEWNHLEGHGYNQGTRSEAELVLGETHTGVLNQVEARVL